MVAPDAPFPTTAASSPGEFKDAYEAAFADGADSIVSIHVASTLSGTIKSAQIARDMLPDREIHVIDSLGASMAEGILAMMGVELAAEGRSAAEIAEVLEARAPDMVMYVALETLEYLRKGGRISGAQAAIGTLLSVKPIIRVKHGVVEQGDRVRTRAKARERLIEMVCERPVERLAILYTVGADVADVPRRGPRPGCGAGLDPRRRPDRAGRAVGRAAPRSRAASARWRCTAPEVPSPGVPFGPSERLREGCVRIADRYHLAGARKVLAAILGPQMSRAPAVSVGPIRDLAGRPVGSSGRRSTATRRSRTARQRGTPADDHRAHGGDDQRLGSRPTPVRPGG